MCACMRVCVLVAVQPGPPGDHQCVSLSENNKFVQGEEKRGWDHQSIPPLFLKLGRRDERERQEEEEDRKKKKSDSNRKTRGRGTEVDNGRKHFNLKTYEQKGSTCAKKHKERKSSRCRTVAVIEGSE